MDDDAKDAPSYSEALGELQAILGELEGEAVDVDLLAARVERADELIRMCRARLEEARMKVERVVEALGDS